jgi:uncharacterized protein
MRKDESEIAEALKGKFPNNTIDYLDQGGTGLLYISKPPVGETQVIKVLRPDIASKLTGKAFRKESEQLISLSSPHIIKGLEVGEIAHGKIKLPYLVMEYFPHKNLDEQRKELWQKDWDLVLQIVHQVLKGLAVLHEKKICHLDIKERNILLDIQGGTAKLLDLGSAKSTSELRGDTTIVGTFTYWPETWRKKLESSKYQIRGTPIVLPRDEISPDVDMHMLSVTIYNVINAAPPPLKKTSIFKRIQLFAERMNWDKRASTADSERYLTAQEAVDDWYKVSTTRSLPAVLQPEGMVRLPIASVTHFNAKIRGIINLPWFLRLKNVLQLATAHLVYPGAKHDRYEHSLGVYQNAIRYLQALFTNDNSVWPSIFLDEEDCIFLAIAALVHDVGHYPFAHQVEELEEAPSHDEISYVLIAGSECPPHLQRKYAAIFEHNGLTNKYGELKNIRSVIEEFGIDYSKFLEFLAYCYGIDLKTKSAVASGTPRKWGLLASILSGPIDADKFDYIQRDSWHCGTKFGRDMDAERLFVSLTPNVEQDAVDLAVTEKGRTTVEQLLDSRYQMFSEVYWHHTVRAFTAMIRRILQIAFERKLLTISDLLSRNETEIVQIVMTRCSSNDACSAREKGAVNQIGTAILERRPYVRLCTISSEGKNNAEIYAKLTAKRYEFYKDTFTWSNVLTQFKGISPSSDLIWDIPKPEKDKVGTITILSKEGAPYTLSARLKTLSENFETSVRKIRLFITPEYRHLFENPEDKKRIEGALRSELKRHLVIR